MIRISQCITLPIWYQWVSPIFGLPPNAPKWVEVPSHGERMSHAADPDLNLVKDFYDQVFVHSRELKAGSHFLADCIEKFNMLRMLGEDRSDFVASDFSAVGSLGSGPGYF